MVYGLNVTGISFPYGNGDIHYSAASQRLIGVNFYNAYVEAQQNYAGSTTPGMIVQLFVGPINNRAQMSFTWPPDVVATSYRLTIIANGQVLAQPIVSSPSFSSSSYLDPNTLYSAYVQGIGPSGTYGAASPTNQFYGVHPFSYYTAGYPNIGIQPQFWVVADTLFPQTVNGTTFQLWEDVSGNNNNLVQPNTQYEPIVVQNKANGHAAVSFSNSYMQTPLETLPTSITIIGVLSVLWLDPGTGYHSAFLGTNLFALFISGQEYEPDWYDFPANGFTASSNVSLLNGNMPTIVTAEWFISGSQTETVFYINGQNAGYGYGPQFNTSTSVIEVGARVDGQYPFYGNTYELLAFNQAIQDVNRHQVEAYLANKYGITIKSQ